MIILLLEAPVVVMEIPKLHLLCIMEPDANTTMKTD